MVLSLMKAFIFSSILLISSHFCAAQFFGLPSDQSNKGKFYIYWGWNLDAYSESEIHFQGPGYDFTLSQVEANDRQSNFETDVYLSPSTMTIPQYNFRIGYFLKENYSLSIGMDHMKYIVTKYQITDFDGYISYEASPIYGGYNQPTVKLRDDFLTFEHTDGLNYLNIDFRRHDHLFHWKMFNVYTMAGLGAGAIIPKTNAQLLENERYDAFNLAGYGANALVAINLKIYRHLFIQSELKGGYINMPDIRTTPSEADKASQSFWFSQLNIVFGASFDLSRKQVKGLKKN